MSKIITAISLLVAIGCESAPRSGTVVDVYHEKRFGFPDWTTVVEQDCTGVRFELWGKRGSIGEHIGWRSGEWHI